jgi:thiol-disulfide isomerase/thioredoxin
MMKKPNKKDASFILKAIIASLVIMAILHALPSSQTQDHTVSQPQLVSDAEVPVIEHAQIVSPETVTERLNSIRASDVLPLLKDANGRPTMLFVYASWCGYCKRLMPNVVSKLRSNQLEHMNVVFLSVDTKLTALAQYLASAGYADAFTPYVVKRNPANKLRDALQSTGSNYAGQIPYLAFYDTQGKLVSEIQGIPRAGDLIAAINEFKTKKQ